MAAESTFLRPLWRRIALVAVCAGWTTIEAVHGQDMWATVAGCMTAYAIWTYLWTWRDTPPAPPPPSKEE